MVLIASDFEFDLVVRDDAKLKDFIVLAFAYLDQLMASIVPQEVLRPVLKTQLQTFG